ncbi:dynamin family protein [Solibacillus sp. MA9]|uniref:Dynamin family protein n=1 Tax=Solibacillus palustris TaxID=2908203 RepID=A0ABS9UAW1_9BACL|nr:dynamin family protein [Solibacillus sp. MA9]MCH7321481.1 dynamin family protein [Solibacillus sp. MA9]
MNVLNKLIETKIILDKIPDLQQFKKSLEQFIRYYEDPVRLLIMGEFSVGKSSIINELLQRNVLPSSLLPTTAITTYIRYDENERMEVHYYSGKVETKPLTDLAKWSSEREKETVAQRQEVEDIHIYVNHPLLKKVVLIDSPGLNSANGHHTAQTENTFNNADDILSIFGYGKVGSSTEVTQLKQLNEMGFIPLGVINMMDEAGDEVDIFDYYQYELAKLKPHIRNMIGVSALDAKIAREESDDELFEISEFPVLLKEIDTIANNVSAKEKKFAMRFQDYCNEVMGALQQYVKTANYTHAVDHMNDLHQLIEQQTVDNLKRTQDELQVIEKEVKDIHSVMEAPKNFVQWIFHKNTSIIQGELPHADYIEYVNTYKELVNSKRKLKQEVQQYNDSTYEQFRSSFHIRRRLKIPRYKFSIQRDKATSIKNRRNFLLADLKEHNKKLKAIQKEMAQHTPYFQTVYSDQLDRLHQSKEKLKAVTDAQIEKNNESLAKANGTMQTMKPLEELLNNLNYFAQMLGFSLQPSSIELTHLALGAKMVRSTNEHNTMLQNAVQLNNIQTIWNAEIQYPEPYNLSIEKVKAFFLYSPKIPTGLVASSIIGFGLYKGAGNLHYLTDLLPEDTEEIVNYESSYSESGGDPSYLLHDPVLVREDQIIGLLEVNEDMYVQRDIEGEYTNGYLLEYGSLWEVYEILGSLYRIQDDFWVDLSNYSDYVFSPNYYVQDFAYDAQEIMRMTANSSSATLYDAPKGNKLYMRLEEGVSYSVEAISENHWMKLESNVWVKLDESMTIYQEAMHNALEPGMASPIRSGTANRELFPIFAGPDRSEPVIGLYEGASGSEVTIYEAYDGDWVNIGRDAWVEAKKYLTIDWAFHDTYSSEEAIGEVKVSTPVLNVRSEPYKESTLLGILREDEVLEVYDFDSNTGWYRIGTDAWVSNDEELVEFTSYETPFETDIFSVIGYVNLTESTNIYNMPSHDAEIIGYTPANVNYTFNTPVESGWVMIFPGEWIYYDESTMDYQLY